MTQERIKEMMAAAEMLARTPIDKLDSHDLDTLVNYGNLTGGFMCGVRWADRNPESPWVNIADRMPEDSLPELTNPERSRDYIKVMIRLKNDTVMEARRRLSSSRMYYWNIPIRMRDQITHWMPIPHIPTEIYNENKNK